MVQLFIIRPDGEVHEITDEKPFRELLEPDETYILNDDDNRLIWLWKGSECSVRSKFIGASKSQEVRGQVGMHYKVIPVDEGEEPDNFLAFLDETPAPGIAKEIREEKELQFDVPGVNKGKKETTAAEKAKKRDLSAKAEKARARFGQGAKPKGPQYDNAGPMYSGSSQPEAQPKKEQAVEQQPQPSIDFKKIMETLESLEIPNGYEREMIIIGNQAFSIVEKKVSFLGNEKVEKVMEKIGTLPEGVFFAKGYAPRVLCEDQKVLAIEFLKSKDGAAPSQAKKKLKVDSKDPKDLAKKFGMNVE